MTSRSSTLVTLTLLAACASPGEEIPNQHDRPIESRDGRTWLWAGEDDQWFDVTNASIDPERFQYGIGKDRIASIDDPLFVAHDDPRLAEADVDADTPVLGVVVSGEARAYPVAVLDMHEIVNDDFGGEPFAVLW